MRIRGSLVLILLSLFSASLAAGYLAATIAPPDTSSATPRTTAGDDPVYHGPAAGGLVALTVNVDWGEEFLPDMLKICETNGVVLTFFVTGRWAAQFPDLVRAMAAAGHEIGNHGYAHPHPDGLSVEGNMRDIQLAEDILRGITGSKPHLYAPPYGERGESVLKAARSLGYRTILWSADSLDWKYRDERTIIERVRRAVDPGGIVLLHPTAATAAALPTLIDDLAAMGLQIVTVSRLLGP